MVHSMLRQDRTLNWLKNRQDPITLQPLQSPLFYNAASHTWYSLSTLTKWMNKSNVFIDPITRVPFTNAQLARMDHIKKQYLNEKQTSFFKKHQKTQKHSLLFQNRKRPLIIDSVLKTKRFAEQLEWIDSRGQKTVKHINDIHANQIQGVMGLLDPCIADLFSMFQTLVDHYDFDYYQQIRSREAMTPTVPILNTFFAEDDEPHHPNITPRELAFLIQCETIESKIKESLLELGEYINYLFMTDEQESRLYMKRVAAEYENWKIQHQDHTRWIHSWLFTAFGELVDFAANSSVALIHDTVQQWAVDSRLL